MKYLVGLLCFAPTLGVFNAPTMPIAPGVDMPMMILGTAVPQMKTYDNCSIQDAVANWFKAGGRHVLTCVGKCYASEPAIGRAWKASNLSRKDIFITTMIPEPYEKEIVIDMIQNQSMRNLGVDYIDMVLIKRACVPLEHGPEYPDRCGNDSKPLRLSTWSGLMELQKMGKIRAVGVSNYNSDHVAEILSLGDKPAVNQVEWHLGFHDDALLDSMRKWNVTMEGYGVLSGPTSSLGYGNPGISLHDPRIIAVAQRYNVSPAKLVLQWVIGKGIAPITATCNVSHAMDDLSAFNLTLDAQDIAFLDGLRLEPITLFM